MRVARRALARVRRGSASPMETRARLAFAADNPVRIGYSMCLTGLFAQAAPSQVLADSPGTMRWRPVRRPR